MKTFLELKHNATYLKLTLQIVGKKLFTSRYTYSHCCKGGSPNLTEMLGKSVEV